MTDRQPGHGRPHTRFARACARLSRGLAWVYDHTAGVFQYQQDWAELTDDNGDYVGDLLGECERCSYNRGECTCKKFCGQIVCRDSGRRGYEPPGDVQLAGPDGWPEDDGRTVTEAVRDAEAAENVPGSVTPSAGGPGYFHDDAPTDVSEMEVMPLDAVEQRLRAADGLPAALVDVPRPDGVGTGRKRAADPVTAGPGHPVIQTVPIGGVYLPLTDDTIVNLTPEPRSGASAWGTQLLRHRVAHQPWVLRILTAPIDDVRRALESPDPDMYLWNASQQRALAGAA